MARILDRSWRDDGAPLTTTVAFAANHVADYGSFDGEFLLKVRTTDLKDLYEKLRVEFAATSDEAAVYAAGKTYGGADA